MHTIRRLFSAQFFINALVIITIGLLFGVSLTMPSMHLTELRFNPFALISGSTLVLSLILLIYMVRKPARSDEHIWLTAYIGGVVFYAGGELFWRLSATGAAAAFWGNISDIGTIIPAAAILFILAYTDQSDRRRPGTTTALLLGSLLMAFFLAYTTIIFNTSPSVFIPQPWGLDTSTSFGTNAGVVADFLWFAVLPIIAFIRLVAFRRHTRNNVLRRQSLIYMFAVIIVPIGGAVTDLILPSLGAVIPSFATVFFGLSSIIFIYGFVRYRLLTITPTLFSNTMLAIMQEAVIATDDAFNIIYLNPTAEALLGMRLETNGRRSLVQALSHESAETFSGAFKHGTKETVSIPQIAIIKGHNGEKVPIRLTASKLRITDFDTWVIILTDISSEVEQRNIIEHEVQVRTAELREARAYLISSINSLEQGFVLVNAKTKIELTNNMVNSLCKHKGDELVGLDIGELMRMIGWNDDTTRAVENVLHSHRARRLDTATSDGSFYQIYLTPVLAGRQALGAAVVIEDVTEQKILDRSKDEFFSIASHELRTPLTAIRGNMSMVQQYFSEALKDETLNTLVGDTHDASVRLIEIVNDFLDSSKLEQGKMVFRLAPMAVGPVIESVKKDLATVSQEAHNTVELVGLDTLPMIVADEARFRQIIYNLLSNANKYSDHATVTITGVAEGNKLRLRVTDTGKGIGPENQKLLFHKFQQAGDSILTRDNTKGTGLGLYIARLLATNMHGDVELEHSEVGKGSTFAAIFPLAASHAKGA